MRPSDGELYQLFDRSPIGMYRSTEDGRFLYVNPALARMLGYTVAELLAVNLVHDVYRDPTVRPKLIADYRGKGVIDGVRVEWKTKDGRPLIAQIFGHVIEDEGNRSSFDASVLDITAQEQQHEELEYTARTLDLVVRQMPATYWLVDRDQRILSTGGAIQELLGYAPDKYLGARMHDSHRDDPGTVDPVAMHERALAGETVTYTSEYRGKTFALTIAPHRRADEIVGAIGTAIDVTASRALERRMVDAQRAESLGVLAGGLAHDFNNLLVAILGNADLGLRDIPAGAPGRIALENIRNAGLRAAELTDQLLAYAGRGGVAAIRVEPRPLVDELLRIMASTMPRTATVRVAVPAGLAVQGDPGQFRQVLLNLLSNALDALDDQPGTIDITARPADHTGDATPDDVITAPAGRYVELAVADDGSGIDAQTRRRIFEPFFTTKASGHGLGLAAVLGVVRAHGGGLRLVSRPGEGARFVVLWPATTSDATTASPARTATRTILVIDDEPLVRDVVARMIEDLGYAALTAPDGATGIASLAGQHIDAVLVDMTMPRMSGAEVIAAVREAHPGVKVVMCTGFDRDGRGPVDADAYLPKPFRIEALETTLHQLFTGPCASPGARRRAGS